jgi:hypothetical protein
MDTTIQRIVRQYPKAIRALELLLALVVLGGVLVAAVSSALDLVSMNWRAVATFDELISRVLLVVIGLELVRMLVVHNLRAILELLAFAIARKMLKPDITALDIALSITAFVALVASAHYFLPSAPESPPPAA